MTKTRIRNTAVSSSKTATSVARTQNVLPTLTGKELLRFISSATSTAADAPRTDEERTDPNNSPFLIAASHVNSDFALARSVNLKGILLLTTGQRPLRPHAVADVLEAARGVP